jgi:hypothetical protein
MIKKILIISPHYPPSNLAAVHRSRLFAQHLPAFGWEPIILTVHEKFYEETLDWNLHKLLPAGQRIEKAGAFNVTKPRLIGDIGLRAFGQLRNRALKLVVNEKIDFVYIPIPSFYVSLIGPYLQRKTGVKFGIDYIDPWVHHFPGSDRLFSRHWLSTKLAKWLEPMAVKKASLITGVAEGYYKGVQQRNPSLINSCLFGAMPYGGEVSDHRHVSDLNKEPYLFTRKKDHFQFVYAGAMLPKAYEPLEQIFKAISGDLQLFDRVEFHFIGTGKKPNDPESYNIRPLAEKYGLWQNIVFEYPARIPYLDVLIHLNAADGIFILGSTEPHYTPSKVFQGVLSKKPILAVLHKDSTALQVIRETGAGISLSLDPEKVSDIALYFPDTFREYVQFSKNFDPASVKMEMFDQYSAKSVTQKLAELLDQTIKQA